jgi:hypothetical protein
LGEGGPPKVVDEVKAFSLGEGYLGSLYMYEEFVDSLEALKYTV